MKNKIKVLEVPTFGIQGGIYQYIFNNLEYMDREKFQIDFLTRNKELIRTKECRKYQFGVKNFTAKERENKELLTREINEILDEGYDVIHLHNAYWLGFLIEKIAMQRKVPKVIIHSHSTRIDIADPKLQAEYSLIHEECKKKFTEADATDFCACSRVAADWLFGPQISRNKIQIMNNAIDVAKYSYNLKVRKEIRDELNIDEKFVIGHIGRFTYQKNHAFLIKVFKKIYQKNNNARLVLIGSGELKEQISKQVFEDGLSKVVLFLGWREDTERIIQGIDLLLLPSRFEGLPITLIEAQTAGLKCIVSKNVTSEVNITENVQFLPFIETNWVDEIEKVSHGYNRIDQKGAITSKGYDIKEQVRNIENLYSI